jgi:hypothetical protein
MDQNVEKCELLVVYVHFFVNYHQAETQKNEKVSPKTDKKLQKALKVPKMANSRNLNVVCPVEFFAPAKNLNL